MRNLETNTYFLFSGILLQLLTGPAGDRYKKIENRQREGRIDRKIDRERDRKYVDR